MKSGLTCGFHGGGGYCNNLGNNIDMVLTQMNYYYLFFQIKINYLN